MANDPTQNRSQGNFVNRPVDKSRSSDNDNKNTGLPKKDDEEIITVESEEEDYVKFDVDKVEELERSKDEFNDK